MRCSYRKWIGVLSVLDTKKCVNLDRDFESAIGPTADIPKNAIDVAIGGKADIGWCTVHVRF
jgi:hypothetical protein